MGLTQNVGHPDALQRVLLMVKSIYHATRLASSPSSNASGQELQVRVSHRHQEGHEVRLDAVETVS